jgi:thiamine kinase-like enzyme
MGMRVMEEAIVSAEKFTPKQLTAVLRRQGALPRGDVTRVTQSKAQSTFASSVWRLRVNYSKDAPPSAPKKLFLKISKPALAPGEFDLKHLQKEVIFYSMIAPAMDKALTIPCYDATYDPETGASHILLKDVSDTHVACLAPSYERNCERAVDSLAYLHAFWWDHPRLGKDVGRFPSWEERQQEWIDAEKRTTAFMAALGDKLRRSWRATYESVLPSLPGLFKRHMEGRNLPLVHGDAHLGNFLFPSGKNAGSTYIIDWQFWHPTIGGTDLAFMIATEWEPETRRRLEQALLRRYHRLLVEHGVCDYRWDDCWNDYRLSVILVSIFIPVWRWSVFKWDVDISTLERSMTAFEQLGCSGLLETA